MKKQKLTKQDKKEIGRNWFWYNYYKSKQQ